LKIPARPAPPIKEQIFRLIYRLSGRRKRIDLFLTPLLKHRRFLPKTLQTTDAWQDTTVKPG
jgi:hypothetical protein